jgi:hypothetical protein
MTTPLDGFGKEVPTPSSVGTTEVVSSPDPGSHPKIPGKFTPTSLELPDGLSSDDWLELVKTLFKSHKAMQWAIGDALVYGEKAFGHPGKPAGVYEDVAWATGYDLGTLYDIASVSRHVPTSLRNETLSWSHHRAVRSFDSEKQKYYLDLAADCRLSVARLRFEIQHDEGNRVWPVGPLTEGERLLLPPALQPPVESEKPRPEDPTPEKPRISAKAAKSFKSLELITYMTRLEIAALERFVRDKKIDTDIGIRALVTIALHGSGDLQQAAEDSKYATDNAPEFEKSYLLYLGQAWFGDENKFPLDTENRPSWDNVASECKSTKARSSPDKIEEYIRSTASILSQIPDMTAEDVQRNIGGISMEKANFILAQANILHEEETKARAMKEKADAEERERWARERKETLERQALERKEADERRSAEAEQVTAVTVNTSEEGVDGVISSEVVIDPAAFDQ